MYINKEELLDYLHEEFPNPMKCHFTYELVENIIDYIENHCDGLEKAHEILVNIIPEVTTKEIEPFINYIPFC